MSGTCVIPGSFDPVTRGHVNIFERASALYESVVVGVLVNSQKQPVFTMEQRVEFIEKSARHLGNVRAMGFEGLTVDFAREMGAKAILRGLRTATDFEYEQQIAALNRMMAPEVETLFIMTDSRYGFLSSRVVREIGSLGGDIAEMVPAAILADIEAFWR